MSENVLQIQIETADVIRAGWILLALLFLAFVLNALDLRKTWAGGQPDDAPGLGTSAAREADGGATPDAAEVPDGSGGLPSGATPTGWRGYA